MRILRRPSVPSEKSGRQVRWYALRKTILAQNKKPAVVDQLSKTAGVIWCPK
jgi:hypothetical protein